MNDAQKPALRRANDNPWYCLATLHGEQPIDHLDQALANKNAEAWRQWFHGILNDDQRADALNAFVIRTGHPQPPPDPADGLDFSHTHFERPVIFDNFQFPGPVDFSSATFSEQASFVGTGFPQNAKFNSATFSGLTTFSRATLNRGDFESVNFCRWVDFQATQFWNPNFRSAKFAGYANFRQATFGGHEISSFEFGMFSDDADFAGTTFNGSVDFGSASFSKTTSFNAAKFNIARFNAVKFSGPIQFINAEFKGSTIFADAHFETQVPDFRGAAMHEATEWHNVTWPKPPSNKNDAQQQVYAYERLKQEMEQLKKHEDEQRFFRKELRARRELESKLSGAWLLNFMYDAFSHYGQSIGLPFLWIAVCFVLGFFVFAGTHVFNGTHLPRASAAALSFANIFSFLPIKREIMTPDMIAGLSTWAQILSSAQSLFGAVLLFFVGLALRNRFRMK